LRLEIASKIDKKKSGKKNFSATKKILTEKSKRACPQAAPNFTCAHNLRRVDRSGARAHFLPLEWALGPIIGRKNGVEPT
jgi:hypothetical protein